MSSLRSQSLNGGDDKYAMNTDNPVFKIKARSLANGNEQPANNGNDNKNVKKTRKEEFKLGDNIDGVDFEGNVHSGSVEKIDRDNDNNIVKVTINDEETNKKVTLDPTSIKKHKPSGTNKDNKTGVYGESRLLNLQDFLCV
jgi:hypothetical protein